MDADSTKYVDVTIESLHCMWYRIDDVPVEALAKAVERAVNDETTFSILNTEGAALVVPWRHVRSVSSADVDEEVEVDEGEDPDDFRTWVLVWERAVLPVVEPAPVFQ